MAVTSKFNSRLGVNVIPEIYAEVKRLSDDQGVSIAEIIRQALEAGLPILRNKYSNTTPVQ